MIGEPAWLLILRRSRVLMSHMLFTENSTSRTSGESLERGKEIVSSDRMGGCIAFGVQYSPSCLVPGLQSRDLLTTRLRHIFKTVYKTSRIRKYDICNCDLSMRSWGKILPILRPLGEIAFLCHFSAKTLHRAPPTDGASGHRIRTKSGFTFAATSLSGDAGNVPGHASHPMSQGQNVGDLPYVPLLGMVVLEE